MNQCQNCGQINAGQSNFCRFCGTKFTPQPPQQFGGNYEYSPPRPYVWKTDEYQIPENKPRQINQVQPLPPPVPQMPPMPMPQPLVHQQHHNLAYNFHCPRCATTLMPRFERKISTAGWITFVCLLVFFFPLFWIGLLIKENVRVCSVCGFRID
jgi:hypothetical protein